MDKIIIRGLEISAKHGVHDFEKTSPQRFIFDVDISFNCRAAAKSDNVNDTVNYSSACCLIEEITLSNTFNLIEKLAYTCAYALMNAFSAESVNITLYKPDAPVKQKFLTVGVSVEVKREKVFLSLGSNLGNRQAFIDAAIQKLGEITGVTVKKVSSFYENPPYGGVAKGDFINCAAEVETFLSPEELLEEIHRIESECQRVREKRWDDRTLDIDIIFYGDKIINTENLTIPHADYKNRKFVLLPLAEIAPYLCDPRTGEKITDILKRV